MEQKLKIEEIATSVPWYVVPVREEGVLFGACPFLGAIGEGNDLEELGQCIRDNIESLIVDLQEADELSPFLMERGWRPVDGEPDQFITPPLEVQLLPA